MPILLRSVLSLIGAFFVVAVLVAVATSVAERVMLGGTGIGVEPTTAFLIVNLVYGVVIAIVGGYVAATVSDHSPLGHAAALAAFMMALSLASWLVVNGGEPAPGQPDWYPWVVALLVPPWAVLGGVLVARRSRRARAQPRFSRRGREAAAQD